MRNFWLVAKYEFRKIVVRRGFILGTLAVPLGMAALIALVIFVETLGENRLPLGYVDRSGAVAASPLSAPSGEDARVEIRAFSDEESALAALEAGKIQAFFILPPDFPKDLSTDLYYLDKPPSNENWRAFDDFLRLHLVAGYPQALRERLVEEPVIRFQDISSNRVFSDESLIDIVLPFIASFFFIIATMSVAGYMLQVVADEKENRTIEILLTSMTPGQLIYGKAFGLFAAAMTQLLIYLLALGVALKVGAPYFAFLQGVSVPWDYLGVMALFFLPAFTLLSAVMVAVGAAVNDLQQGQQVAGVLNFLFMLPLFAMVFLFQNPSHPVVVFLTIFPTTSFLTVSLRWGLGSIPVWQLGAGWGVLVASTVIMVWAAARIFRAGMLRYGQPLDLKSVASALRSR